MAVRNGSKAIVAAAVVLFASNAGAQVTSITAGKGLMGGGSGPNVTIDVGVGNGLLNTADRIRLRAAGQSCSAGQHMIGFDAIGNILCQTTPTPFMMENTILYTVQPLAGGAMDLAVMKGDGTGKMVLLSMSGSTSGANWAPYNSLMAFSSVASTTGFGEIFLANADGSGKRQITSNSEEWGSLDPRFVKGRTKIWFTRQRYGVGDMWEIGLDGTGQTRLTNFESQAKVLLNYNVDAAEANVAYTKCGIGYAPGCEIYFASIDFSNEVRLTNNGTHDRINDFSPDGQAIVFQRNDDPSGEGLPINLYRMNVDGTGEAKLTNVTGNNYCLWANWSPDGARIAMGCHDGTQYDVFVMNADGSNVVNITNTADKNETPSDWQ